MGNKLEQLFNSLIKRGRVPFGESRIDEINRAEQYVGNWNWCCRGMKDAIQKRKSTRQLVSKESGLWQFCMSKGFTPNVSCYRWEKWFYDIDDLTQCEADVSDNYWYRIIESSLKDESELEKFLLDNIKVGNEQL